ncbi:crAss001_48 related protein [Lentilactobacillus kosonis]|uniref:Uncharacterized protein n=1 Tax=Lentilactobacillus kosonis TaxID=2810561 RepID=A0A401FPL9_9LACO|nr:hypothetical protein [Lentilactobacillus kosonis]GAY74330.1 hypothetical protein NBRC111893_2476 [Lentilactobacillus kosonis]
MTKSENKAIIDKLKMEAKGLDERIEKLEDSFNNRFFSSKYSDKESNNKSLMHVQLHSMKNYKHCVERRISMLESVE